MSALEWILIAVIAGIIEIFTSGFWFLWLSLAAILVAAGASLKWLVKLPGQLLIFSLFTLIFIIFTRPLVLKTIKTNDTKSNTDALMGQHGVTLTAITPWEYGQIKVNGEVWSVVSQEEIEAGTRVQVIGIEGVKLVVKRSPSE